MTGGGWLEDLEGVKDIVDGDSSDVVLPMRPALRFVGLTVSDDPVNERTNVDATAPSARAAGILEMIGNVNNAETAPVIGLIEKLLVTASVAANLTGLEAPTTDAWRVVDVFNIGDEDVTLKHNSSSSAVANRFITFDAMDFVLTAEGGRCTLAHDPDGSWLVIPG